MRERRAAALAVCVLVPLALGAAGCVCTVEGAAGAHGHQHHPPPPPPPPPGFGHVQLPAPGGPAPQGPPVIRGGGAFGNDQPTADSLRGTIYFLPEGTQRLPDFAPLTPVGVLFTRQLNISPRRFDAGFPGIDGRFEWFGIRYEGQFRVGREGSYGWKLNSDDGARVSVDGVVVVDNDGLHPPATKESRAPLKAGAHTIRVDYFQGPRFYVALELWVTPPGGREQLWSASF